MNNLLKEEKLRPEIKGFSSNIYETSAKPQNLYYSNYFESKEIKKLEKMQIKTMNNNKSIYEEAEEELKEELKDFTKNDKVLSAISKIPIKFNEIDYESTKNHIEKTSQISEMNKFESKTVKSAKKSPKKTAFSSTISKVNTTSKKKPYKKEENSLKNVNNDKKIINFSSEESEINQIQVKSKIINKTSEKTKESLLSSVLNKSNLQRSTIKIIPKNPENSKIINKNSKNPKENMQCDSYLKRIIHLSKNEKGMSFSASLIIVSCRSACLCLSLTEVPFPEYAI